MSNLFRYHPIQKAGIRMQRMLMVAMGESWIGNMTNEDLRALVGW